MTDSMLSQNKLKVLFMFTEKVPEVDSVALTDVTLNTGIDTYVRPGKTQNNLVIEEQKRAGFFKNHRNLHALLQREITNPVIEEGEFVSTEMRTRKGEHYLTYEAITLYIEHAIRGHKAYSNGLTYNSKNIFVLKNDEVALHNILQDLAIKINEDAKFIYIDAIHSIPFYIRNIQGRINCFFVDSESGKHSRLIDIVKQTYSGARIFYSTVTLQKDFYSCSTFSIKTLLYFVKHGAELFPYLDANNSNMVDKNLYSVDEAHLMPVLLKMNQSRLALSDSNKDTIVSVKQKLTFEEYLKKYSVTIDGKSFNAAALIKKYKYFDVINKYINQNIGKNVVSVDPNQPLPIELKERHEKYTRLPNQITNTARFNLIDHYVELQSNFDTQMAQNHEVPLGLATKKTLQLISNKYPQFQNAYIKRFSQQVLAHTESVLIEKLLFIAAYFEMQDLAHLSEYMDFAAKLSVLFASYEDVVIYFKKHGQVHAKQPVHDLCLFNLSAAEQGRWNKEFWRALVLEYGLVATKYLALAPIIDALLIKHQDSLDVTVHNTVLKRIKAVLVHHNYQRANENPELAGLCLRFKRSPEQFEQNLELVQRSRKSYDVLPEITINGADLNPELAKFTFSKLPINDLRGYFLGEYTSCCQSLNKQGASCAIDGMTSAFSGFYVVYERGVIVAQTWAWVGKQTDFVFDSWEFVNLAQSYMCEPFIKKAAELIIQSGFRRVLLGKGGKTPKINFEEDANPGKFRIDCEYSDAQKQYLIQSNPQSEMFHLFTGFMRRYDFDSNLLSGLFSEKSTAESETQQLTQIINDKQVTYNQFFYLILFFYMHEQEILHQLTPSNQALLQASLKTFGRQMYPLFLMDSTNDDSVLGIFIRMDVNNVQWIFNYLGEYNALSFGLTLVSTQESLIIYELVRSDNSTALLNLMETNKIQCSWEELALSTIHRKKSALYIAAKYNATRCLKLFLANKISDHQRLLEIIYTPIVDYSKANIFHYFALYDAIDIMKLLINNNFTLPIERNSNVGIACLFTRAPIFTGETLQPMATPYGVAFFSNSHKVFAYLNELGFLKDGVSVIAIDEPVKYLIAQNNIERIKYLRSLCENEKSWLKCLVDDYHNFHVIRDAQIKGFNHIANYLFDSLKEFASIHEILRCNQFQKYDSFDIFLNKKLNQEELQFLNKVLFVYKDHGDKLNEVISLIDFLCIAVLNLDVGLFNSVLSCYSSNKKSFDALLISENDKKSLLLKLIKYIDADPVRCNAIDMTKKKIFIDSLLKVCTQAQQKRLVEGLNDWSRIKRDTTTIILSHIKSIDNGKYIIAWANLDATSPLKRSLSQFSNFEKDSPSVLLAIYDDLYGVNQVTAYLLSKPIDIPYYIFKDEQVFSLMDRLFQFIGDDVKTLENLFWDCYGTSKWTYNGNFYPRIFDYKKLSDSVLIEAISVKKREKVYIYDSHNIMNLIMTAQVWEALAKRLDKQELYAVTLDIYKDFYSLLIKEVAETVKTAFEAWVFHHSLSVFENMNTIIAEHSDNSQMRLEVASDYLAESQEEQLTNKIMLILAASTGAERQELLSGFKEQRLLNQFKNNSEFIEYITALNQLEQVAQLKISLTQINDARRGPKFFKPVVDECAQALDLIAKVEKRKWGSFDKDNKLTFCSAAEINQLYNELSNSTHKVSKMNELHAAVAGDSIITQKPANDDSKSESREAKKSSSCVIT